MAEFEDKIESLYDAERDYRDAVNDIFTADCPGLTPCELAAMRAKFGSYLHNIFKLMGETRALLIPCIQTEEGGD